MNDAMCEDMWRRWFALWPLKQGFMKRIQKVGATAHFGLSLNSYICSTFLE